MKFLIVVTVMLAVACNASPQRRSQPKQQPQARSYEQAIPAEQDFREPIQVADFKEVAQEYRPQANYKQAEYKQPSTDYKQQGPSQQVIQEFKPRDPLETTTWIPIIKFAKEQELDGSYKTSYETGNNIIAEETGFLKSVGEDAKETLVQHGSYTYTAPDGQLISVEYTADEFGFRATGDHIPTPPPVSPEIQKGLDLIYAGIKANQERQALEEKANPEAFARRQADRAALDYAGQYYQQ